MFLLLASHQVASPSQVQVYEPTSPRQVRVTSTQAQVKSKSSPHPKSTSPSQVRVHEPASPSQVRVTSAHVQVKSKSSKNRTRVQVRTRVIHLWGSVKKRRSRDFGGQ